MTFIALPVFENGSGMEDWLKYDAFFDKCRRNYPKKRDMITRVPQVSHNLVQVLITTRTTGL